MEEHVDRSSPDVIARDCRASVCDVNNQGQMCASELGYMDI